MGTAEEAHYRWDFLCSPTEVYCFLLFSRMTPLRYLRVLPLSLSSRRPFVTRFGDRFAVLLRSQSRKPQIQISLPRLLEDRASPLAQGRFGSQAAGVYGTVTVVSVADGLCQPPTGLSRASASAGPQVFGSYWYIGVPALSAGSTMRHASST